MVNSVCVLVGVCGFLLITKKQLSHLKGKRAIDRKHLNKVKRKRCTMNAIGFPKNEIKFYKFETKKVE